MDIRKENKKIVEMHKICQEMLVISSFLSFLGSLGVTFERLFANFGSLSKRKCHKVAKVLPKYPKGAPNAPKRLPKGYQKTFKKHHESVSGKIEKE